MPETKEQLELLYDSIIRSSFAPRPYADGMIGGGETIKGEYKVPHGLTEEQAILATIGATMDEKVMEQTRCSSSAGSARELDWKRTFLFRDYPGHDEKRGIFYNDAINEGRALAAEAFAEYENGNPQKVNEMIARASKSITAEYKKRPVEGNYLWYNTSAAMKLVKEASTSPAMKNITGFDGKTEQYYNAKEKIADLQKDSTVFNGQFASDKNFTEKENYRELLLEKTAKEAIVKAYNEQEENILVNSQDTVTEDMLPLNEETELPDTAYQKWQPYLDKKAEAAEMYRETHPNTVAEKISTPEGKQELIEQTKKTVETSDRFINAVNAKTNLTALGDIKANVPDSRSEEEIAGQNARWNTYEKQLDNDYKAAVKESLAFSGTLEKKFDEIAKQNGLGDYVIVNRDIIKDKFSGVEKYMRNQNAVYMAERETGKIIRIQSENFTDFKAEPVDRIPPMPASTTMNKGYFYANAIKEGLEEVSKMELTVLSADSENGEISDAFTSYREVLRDSFENPNSTRVTEISHAAEELEKACESLDGPVKEKIHTYIGNVSKAFENAEKLEKESEDRLLQYNAGSKSEEHKLQAALEHEKLKETENLLYGDKAAGNRSLEATTSLVKYMDAVKAETESNSVIRQYFTDMFEAISHLQTYTENLYKRDADGNLPAYTKENQTEMLNLYSKAITEVSNVTVPDGNKALSQNISDVKTLLERDVTTLAKIAPRENVSLAQAIEGTHVQRINATGIEFSTVGAASNKRQAMTIERNGKEVKGFFTAEKLFAPDVPKILNELEDTFDAREVAQKYRPFLRDAVKTIATDLSFNKYSVNELAAKYATERGIDGRLPTEDELDDIDLLGSEIDSMSDAFAKDWDGLQKLQYQYEFGVEATKGSNISNRNVAMSRVANLLGMPNILANSEQFEITDGDKTVKGVFMEVSEGKGYDDIMPDDIANFGDKGFDNPAFLKDAADLQVLDYICQNVDRHQNNVFYKFSPDGSQLIGLQGIDNDLSFGKANVADDYKLTEAANTFEQLTVVSKDASDRIMALDEETFKASLDGLGLTDDERQSAADRLAKVQDAIRAGKIEVVTDKQFAERKFDDFAKGQFSGSQFGRLNDMRQKLTSVATKNYDRTMRKTQDALDNPEHEQKKFTFEKVETLDGISEAQFKRDIEKADAFSTRVAASQKWIWGKGSPEFRAIENNLKDYKEFVQNFPKEPSDMDYLKMQAKIESLGDTADKYIATKNPNDKNKKTQQRLEIAKELKKFSFDRLKEFKESLHRKDEIAVEEMNAKLKAQAFKLSDVQTAANEKELLLKDMGINDNVAKMQADVYVARERLTAQQEGRMPLEKPETNIELISKLVFNDMVERERVATNGKGFKITEANAQSYVKGKYEYLVIKGNSDRIINIIKNLDSVQDAAKNLTPETIGNIAKPEGISRITGKVLSEISKNGDHAKEIISSEPAKKLEATKDDDEASIG